MPFFNKKNQVSLEKWLILRPRHQIYKMSLELEVLKNKTKQKNKNGNMSAGYRGHMKALPIVKGELIGVPSQHGSVAEHRSMNQEVTFRFPVRTHA